MTDRLTEARELLAATEGHTPGPWILSSISPAGGSTQYRVRTPWNKPLCWGPNRDGDLQQTHPETLGRWRSPERMWCHGVEGEPIGHPIGPDDEMVPCEVCNANHDQDRDDLHLIAAAPSLRDLLAWAVGEVERLREALKNFIAGSFHDMGEEHYSDMTCKLCGWSRRRHTSPHSKFNPRTVCPVVNAEAALRGKEVQGG